MTNPFPYYYDDLLTQNINKQVNHEIIRFAGMYLLKKMSILDTKTSSAHQQFEPTVPLAEEDEILEPILDQLLFHDLIHIDTKQSLYLLEEKGHQSIQQLIAEAEYYIEKYQNFDATIRVRMMRKDYLNPLRARFLWGLYDGEFDDFVQYQRNLNIAQQEQADWRNIVTAKEFYDSLFHEMEQVAVLSESEMDNFIDEVHQQKNPCKANPAVIAEGFFAPDPNPFFWYTILF